jgi:predicted nucleic acid-binding protein
VRFFDASALVKRYVRERDSTRVRRLLSAGDIGVCRLSEVEVVSALARLAREGAISVARRDAAGTAFVGDLAAWVIIELHPDVTRAARRLVLQHGLRTGDGLQLAAALVLQEALGPIEEFVAYDSHLLEAARAEQLMVRSRLRR